MCLRMASEGDFFYNTMKGKLKMKIAIVCALCGISLAACAIEPVVNGSEYVFTVNEGATETFSSGIGGSGVTLVKRGLGKLTLSGQGNCGFSGSIRVEAGTLSAAPEAFLGYDQGTSTWSSLGKPDVTVWDGACFDCSGAGNKGWGPQVFGVLTLAGEGPDGNGALVRVPATSEDNDFPMFASMTLTGDATVNFPSRFRMCSLAGNGHVLTVKGTSSTSWYLYGVSFSLGAAGSVVCEGGIDADKAASAAIVIQGNSTFAGTDGNTLSLKGFKIQVSSNTIDPKIPYAISIVKSTGQERADIVAGANMTLNGPIDVEDGMKVYFKGNENCVLQVNGAVALKDGKFYTTGDGKVVFNGSVALEQSANWKAEEWLQSMETVFSGTGAKQLSGQLYGATGKRLTFDGAEFVRLGGQYSTQFNVYGPSRSNPYELTITNSTVDIQAGLFLGIWDNGYGAMTITGDSVVTNASKIHVGGYNNSATRHYGRLVQNGGRLVSPGEINIGYNQNTYGFYDLQDGELVLDGNVYVGRYGGSGTFRMAGGTLLENSGTMPLGYENLAGYGAFIQSGGYAKSCVTFSTASAADNACGLILLEGNSTTNVYRNADFVFSPTSAYEGIFAVNDGAVFMARRICRSTDAMTGTGHFALSLNGGVLSQTWSGNFWQSSGQDAPMPPNEVLVHENGAVVAPYNDPNDDLRWADAYSAPFLAPTGKIVSAIALPTGEPFAADSYYMGPPQVRIYGSGVGAAAVAEYDAATRRVTGIRVVAPGSGYDDATTATIASSDNTTVYNCAVTVADAPATGAGITIDAGGRTVIFRGANTYHGPTAVKSGTLRLENEQALPTGSDLVVRENAVLDVCGAHVQVPSLEIGGVVSNGDISVENTLKLSLAGSGANVMGCLSLLDGATVELSGAIAEESQALLTAQSIVRCGRVDFTGVPEGYTCRIRGGNIICDKSGMVMIFR